MPALQPLVLTLDPDGTPKTETYYPAMSTGTSTEFVDNSPSMVYDARLVRTVVRPAAAGNTGRRTEHLGVRPIPLSSGECCIDVTKPEGNTFSINTMIRKTSSKAEAEELVDMIIAYVSHADFRDLVTSTGWYA